MADVDVQRTTLHVRLAPERGRMEVEGSVVLLARRDGVASGSLVLAEAFGTPAFTVDGQPRAAAGRPCRWANADARLWEIPLPAPLAREKRVEIAFRYAGTPDWPLDGRITPHLSWMLPQAAWFPRLGTGLVGGDDWSEIDVTVTAPPGQIVVANGLPVSEGKGSDAHWRSTVPGSAFFVAGELTIDTMAWSGKTLAWYSPAGRPAARGDGLASLGPLLRSEQEAFGAYPQSRLSVLQLPAPWPAGESYAAAGAVLLDDRPPEPRRLAHEIAHQWWGLSVQTPLLEGLARYAEWRFTMAGPRSPVGERRPPRQEAPAGDRSPAVDGTPRASDEIGGSYPEFAAHYPDRPIREALFQFQEPQRRALAYDKLGAVFRMLAGLMGEDRFTKLLREFERRYTGRRAGLEEFQILARSIARQDLDWFFTQWINGPGMPTLRLERVAARPNGRGYHLTLQVSQSPPPFRLPLQVAIHTAAGSERRTVDLTETTHELEIDCKGRPSAVELDPDGEVLMDRRASSLSYSLTPADIATPE
jgi:hypothetical protein